MPFFGKRWRVLVAVFVPIALVCLLLVGCQGASGAPGLPGPPGTAGPTGPAGEPGSQATAMIVVSPVGGLPKATTYFSGAGFVPGEKIKLLLHVEGTTIMCGPKGGMAVIEANEYGAFSFSQLRHRAIEAGIYTLEAIGDKGSMATAPYQVLAKE